MAAIKTCNMIKTVSPSALKRVVSTSATSRNTTTPSAFVLEQERTATCPFKNILNTKPIRRNESQTSRDIPTASSELKSFEEIPGPKGLPIVGTLFDYFKKDGLRFNKMHEAYQKRAIEHGPIYKEKIATISTVVVSDPREYSKVIRSEGRYPIRREMEPIAHYRRQKNLDLGLVNDKGENWYKLRTVTAPKMLKMKEVLDFCEPMNDVGNDFVAHLADMRQSNDEVVGLEKELFKWSFESIGTFLFEERIGCFSKPTPTKAQQFIDHLQEFFKYLQPLMFNVPIYKLYPTKLWKKFEYHSDAVFQLGRYFINKKVAELEKAAQLPSASQGPASEQRVPFLTYMLSQESLTTDDALSTAVDLLVAATENTANAMLWTLYCLAENPEAQQKMYEETKAVLGDSKEINAKNISKLTYVKAVLKEALRKYPVSWATSRITQEDMEVCGHHIPAGTHIQANLYGMFRDEKLFHDNDSFKPERWLKDSKMDATLKGLSSLVWGHGARMCIGRRFAEQEMHIALTKIVQNFNLQYEREPIHATLNTVMTPDRPLVIKFEPRSL
ncbi:cytochrome P450 10-like [Dreissena polymorpha]|uniref:cytochrome P450 10-like n=1 Tax=Dreissena polymorpha TaxID=45954 RepID=UPI002264B8B3|nr:cytochrome P450 10-like [Dreissena polymorpha]